MRICSEHEDYEVPFIWTFSFIGAEYWCPYCNSTRGMMGAGPNVEGSEELNKRLELYKKATIKYLNARSTLICSKTKWKGEYIEPSELPKEEIERLKKIVSSGWKLNVKIEDLR